MTGAKELQPYDGPRSSLSIGLGFGRCSGISPEFTRRFAEGIGKLAGSMSEDRREKTRKLIASMPEATRLAKVNRPYPSVRVAKPPKLTGKLSVPRFFGYDWILAPVLKPIWGL
ncbi:hypothetical protein BHM03_00018818 [Ensete ventricosum]|nr:hypothetical protein BHM03_00018818 [Ensete ventricosum]